MTGCARCAAGQVVPTSGASHCLACIPGRYHDGIFIELGSRIYGGEAVSSFAAASSKCLQCSGLSRQYSAKPGAASCETCPDDGFSNDDRSRIALAVAARDILPPSPLQPGREYAADINCQLLQFHSEWVSDGGCGD